MLSQWPGIKLKILIQFNCPQKRQSRVNFNQRLIHLNAYDNIKGEVKNVRLDMYNNEWVLLCFFFILFVCLCVAR